MWGAHVGLAKLAVQCSADTFVVNQTLVLRINICGEIRHLRQAAKNVTSKCRTPDSKTTRKPTLSKIKRVAMPVHKPTQIAAHLILPNRSKTISGLTIWRQLLTQNGFKTYLYDQIIDKVILIKLVTY